MSAQKPDDDFPSPSHFEECDSPRKRPRLDNSSRKSWSLMDRRTDQEVLQEMGVSLLEPDELEGLCDVLNSGHSHKTLKRKRDIENVNPNVLVTSPCKSISKSPRGKVCSPSPGPSKAKSPRSVEKARPLQPTEVLETTLLEEYLIDEETPLAQVTSVPQEFSCVDRKHSSYTPLGQEEELIINRRTKCEPSGEDTFNVLSDEMILSVFRWLPKRTLAHCMLVCKRWHRVACDETLWQRLDLGNKTLNKDALGKILDRKPVIVRLASSEIGEWHPTTPPSPCRIQYLDLSMSTIDLKTLDCLLARCTGLKKLSLESVQVETSTCVLIGKCSNLETLNVTMAQGILEEGLTAILTGCPGLQSLNISWCNLSEETLEILVTMLPPKLQRLNVGGSRIMTNEMVIKLVERCPRLLELDLSDCSRVSEPGVRAVQTLTRLEHLALSRCYLLPPRVLTRHLVPTASQIVTTAGHIVTTACPQPLELALSDCSRVSEPGVRAVQTLTRLEHLALSRCYLLPPRVLTKLSCMVSLQYLEVWGMLAPASLNALRAALPAIHLNQFMFSAIARPTVGTRRTSIWGLRTRD